MARARGGHHLRVVWSTTSAGDPDDESFGLGALLVELTAAGSDVRVLCLTNGEASMLGAGDDLGVLRRGEIEAAADILGIGRVRLAGYPDGGLANVPPAHIDAEIEQDLEDAALLVVFEPGGVTGHPDHRAATAAANRVAARRGLQVLAWGVAPDVAEQLNGERATSFLAFDGVDVTVDRSVQALAIACHASQARGNPVLTRRPQLQGNRERMRLS